MSSMAEFAITTTICEKKNEPLDLSPVDLYWGGQAIDLSFGH